MKSYHFEVGDAGDGAAYEFDVQETDPAAALKTARQGLEYLHHVDGALSVLVETQGMSDLQLKFDPDLVGYQHITNLSDAEREEYL